MPKTSASAVSAKLHKAGFAIVSGDRRREGIRVSKSVLGEVNIVVDLDMHRPAKRLADLVDEELKTWEGYEYRRRDDVFFYISKAEPQAKIVDLLAKHQPKPARGVGRGGKPGLLVECEGCEFETFIADMPFSDTRADLRLDFARHQAKILREHATITEK